MKEINIKDLLDVLNVYLDKKIINEKQFDEDLVGYGIDSIKFIHIIVEFEERFKCEISDDKLLISEMNSVNKILNVLQETGLLIHKEF